MRPIMFLFLTACAAGPNVDISADPPDSLSAMRLFTWDGEDIVYNDGIVPYDLNSPLFSDYALKDRAIYIPEGEAASFESNDAIEFPVGTAIIKNFLMADDLRKEDPVKTLVETRLFIRYESGWEAFPYLWDDEGKDAVLKKGGAVKNFTFIDSQGETQDLAYLVPQKNQCLECHELKDEEGNLYLTPIGPKARHMNRDFEYESGSANQLEHLASLGLLTGLPAMSEVDKAFSQDEWIERGVADLSPTELDEAARDYLDINCAHCHNPDGVNGVSSQLFLNHDNEDMFHLGVCKKPGSAGEGGLDREFDIVPGDPEASILHYRMVTTELGAMMPLLGRGLEHVEGTDLIWAWIADMPADDCK